MIHQKKIICTLGPTSFDRKILNKLKKEKVDIFRINLSHTKRQNILSTIKYLKKNKVKKLRFTEIDELVQILNKTNIFLKEKNIDFIFFYLPRESETKDSPKNLEIKNNLLKKLKYNNIKFFDLTEKKYLNLDQKIYLDELI